LRTGKRRETRRLALELLGRYSLGEEPRLLLEEASLLTDELDYDYLRSLFAGILDKRQALDVLIKRFLKGWRLERLNRVDHSILWIAIYELRFMQKQIPPKSVINEAVELAKEFGSTEKTPGLVNAILDKIWHFVTEEEAGQV
jgi:N utilization substance protein B